MCFHTTYRVRFKEKRHQKRSNLHRIDGDKHILEDGVIEGQSEESKEPSEAKHGTGHRQIPNRSTSITHAHITI